MSKGGPGIISNTAERAPSMLARASFLVSSLCNYASPVAKDMLCAKSYLCFFAKLYVFFVNLY